MKRKLILSLVGLSSVGSMCTYWALAQDVVQTAQTPVAPTAPAAAPVSAANIAPRAAASAPSASADVLATRPAGQLYRSAASAYTVAAQEGLAYVVTSEESGLQAEIRTLMGKYSSADELAKATIVGELKVALEKSFDLRQEERLQELKKLEEQLTRLKEVHAKRSNQKAQIVNDRIQQLVREAEGLGWGSSDVGSSPVGNLFRTTRPPVTTYTAPISGDGVEKTPGQATTPVAPAFNTSKP